MHVMNLCLIEEACTKSMGTASASLCQRAAVALAERCRCGVGDNVPAALTLKDLLCSFSLCIETRCTARIAQQLRQIWRLLAGCLQRTQCPACGLWLSPGPLLWWPGRCTD